MGQTGGRNTSVVWISKKIARAVVPQQALSIKKAIKVSVEKFEVAKPTGHYSMQYVAAMMQMVPQRLMGSNDFSRMVTRSD